MSWMNNLFPPVNGTSSVEWGGGVRRPENNFFVTGKTPEIGSVEAFAQYDIALNNGHEGSNQTINQAGYSGVANPRWIA